MCAGRIRLAILAIFNKYNKLAVIVVGKVAKQVAKVAEVAKISRESMSGHVAILMTGTKRRSARPFAWRRCPWLRAEVCER